VKKTKTVLPSTYLKATSVTAAVLTALYGAPAHADADIGISEVTVTATRRVTTAQDIPLSITAVSVPLSRKRGSRTSRGWRTPWQESTSPTKVRLAASTVAP